MRIDDLDFDEKQLIFWKAGLTFTRPWHGALKTLREKGLVTHGDLMSFKFTPKGEELFANLPSE